MTGLDDEPLIASDPLAVTVYGLVAASPVRSTMGIDDPGVRPDRAGSVSDRETVVSTA